MAETGTAARPGQRPAAPGGEPAVPGRRRRFDPRWELFAFLELLAACGFALAQPLLDTTGRSPEFFLFNSADTIDFVLLLVGATLPLPLALWAAGALTGVAGRRTREVVHVVILGGVFTVLAVVAGKQLLPLRGAALVAVALAAGAGLALLYAKAQFLRQMLRVASIGPVLFVALFVFASPSGSVLLNGRAPASGSGGGIATAGAAHPPIVVILLDEFPVISLMDGNGNIDADRFPNFAALAKGSTWYRNATAVSPYTPYAVPAMLTGRYPYKSVAPHHIEWPDNLFTLLSGTYNLKVQESIALMCPPEACGATVAEEEPPGGSVRAVLRDARGLARDIVSPNDSAEDPTAGFVETTANEAGQEAPAGTGPPAADASDDTERKSKFLTSFGFDAIHDNQPSRFTDFVAGLEPSDKPTFHFVHILLPHTPYRHLPSGVRYDPVPDKLKALTGEGEPEGMAGWWQNSLRERYDAQLVYTDALIGEALDRLRETGLYDDALVMVTADHGVTFTPGFYKRNYEASAADILWVPLFVKEPGQAEGKVDDRNIEHADLLPTLASYAGVEIPWRVDGISHVGGNRDRTEKWWYPKPGERVTVDPANFQTVLRGWGPVEALPELVGRPVAELAVTSGSQVARVRELGAFANLDPAAGRLPAFVNGTLPGSVPDGARVAIAVNGKIGAVSTTARENGEKVWFAALVEDATLFKAGQNSLELFLVGADGTTLERLALEDLGG